MPIEVTWYNNAKTIILENYPPKWTWDDFYALREIVPPMMSEVPHRVSIIADFGNNLDIPSGNAMLHARNVINAFPENWGLLVIISRSALINSFVNMFARIFPLQWARKIYLVKSYEDALSTIARYQDEKA
jgi:hypothetical protein